MAVSIAAAVEYAIKEAKRSGSWGLWKHSKEFSDRIDEDYANAFPPIVKRIRKRAEQPRPV